MTPFSSPFLSPPYPADVTAHVILFITNPEQLALVRQRTQWRGPLVHTFLVGCRLAANCSKGESPCCAARLTLRMLAAHARAC